MAGRKEPDDRALTPEAIAQAALALIDREGLETFSTRRLGAVLGVEAMALYHHFPSKAALLDTVAAELLSRVKLPREPRKSWRAWQVDVARAYRDVGLRHPQAFPLLAARRFNAPAGFAFFDANIRALSAAGFDIRTAARFTRVIGTFVNGTVLAEIATRDATPASITNNPSATNYPLAARAAPYAARPGMDGVFEAGLSLLLDGMERLLA